MAYIIIDDLQIPAKKYDSEADAKQEASDNELVVKDNDGHFWVVEEEEYSKIEAYGYTVIEK
ncbi:hypothetical protein [Alteribacillus sp. HJP-4]|uniref:hypothetical protein n=1 Tax=Alteribacillus sp. HJP-4 TaxID=2775394 RepID=UPI0035CCD9E0